MGAGLVLIQNLISVLVAEQCALFLPQISCHLRSCDHLSRMVDRAKLRNGVLGIRRLIYLCRNDLGPASALAQFLRKYSSVGW